MWYCSILNKSAQTKAKDNIVVVLNSDLVQLALGGSYQSRPG